MPDCFELQMAVSATISMVDATLVQLDALLLLLTQQVAMLEACLMGAFENATITRETKSKLSKLKKRKTAVEKLRAHIAAYQAA